MAQGARQSTAGPAARPPAAGPAPLRRNRAFMVLFVLFDLAEGAALPQLVSEELILTGIMCGVAAAATLARGMRQLSPPARAGEPARPS